MPLVKPRLQISEYRDQRKARLKKRENRLRMVSLTLTSMVDMFAILVIFLLTNSSTVTQWLEVSQSIKLPGAIHASAPQKASSLQITADAIWDKDSKIVSLEEIKNPAGKAKLKDWLTGQPHTNDFHIAADENIPYGNIKKVISVLQAEKIARVNLAVQPLSRVN